MIRGVVFDKDNNCNVEWKTSTGEVYFVGSWNYWITGQTGLNFYPWAIEFDNNYDLYLGGDFTLFNSETNNKAIKLTNYGSKDYSFDIGTGFYYFASPTIRSVLYDNNTNTVLYSGKFSSYNGTLEQGIIRLFTDGTIDTSFNTTGTTGIGFGTGGQYASTMLFHQGKYLCTGGFGTYRGIGVGFIVRINTDGTLDSTFDTSVGFQLGSVTQSKIDYDDKDSIYAVGPFLKYNNVSSPYIAKITSGATLDTSFNVGTGFSGGGPGSLELYNNGIYVVGGFSSYNGTTVNRIVKLKKDGTIDTSFDAGLSGNGPNNSISYIKQIRDKFYCGGNFTSWNGDYTYKFMVSLNLDGTVNTGFIPKFDDGSVIQRIAVDDNNQMFVSGNFTSYDGKTNNYLVRIDLNGNII